MNRSVWGYELRIAGSSARTATYVGISMRSKIVGVMLLSGALVITEAAAIGLVVATVQFATLVHLAALGETIFERAGVLNLGVEGMMAIGAMAGYVAAVATGSPWIGFPVGGLAAGLLALLHAVTSVALGADQVVSGPALTILGPGLADFLGAGYTDDARRVLFTNIHIPGVSEIPWVCETIFSASPVSYVAVLLGVATWLVCLAAVSVWVFARSARVPRPPTQPVTVLPRYACRRWWSVGPWPDSRGPTSRSTWWATGARAWSPAAAGLPWPS